MLLFNIFELYTSNTLPIVKFDRQLMFELSFRNGININDSIYYFLGYTDERSGICLYYSLTSGKKIELPEHIPGISAYKFKEDDSFTTVDDYFKESSLIKNFGLSKCFLSNSNLTIKRDKITKKVYFDVQVSRRNMNNIIDLLNKGILIPKESKCIIIFSKGIHDACITSLIFFKTKNGNFGICSRSMVNNVSLFENIINHYLDHVSFRVSTEILYRVLSYNISVYEKPVTDFCEIVKNNVNTKINKQTE